MNDLDTRQDAGAVALTLNGRPIVLSQPRSARLSEALRGGAGTRDVKVGCNAGDCGACTVLLDGEPVCACLIALGRAEGRRVETVSGLVERDEAAKALASSFLLYGAAQCGICTPGMIVSATALLRRDPAPNEQAVKDALGGVLCRCTGYRKIIAAVMQAFVPTARPPASGGVGSSPVRLDGRTKVDGTELFGDDVAPADCLALLLVRSPFDHAVFEIGDTSAFLENRPGLVRVLTARDIPGENRHGVIPGFIDQPVFAERVARFRGEAIAAIAGEADAIARLDLARFPVRWQKLDAVTTPQQALVGGARLVHEGRAGNVLCAGRVERGDIEAALATADVVVEGDFTTSFVEHAYIEPEAAYARQIGDRIVVHACTQSTHMNRDNLARILGLPLEAVRVVPTAVGGGFGSKLDLSAQPYVALAAWHLGRPIRMTYSRTESMQSTTKRHPSQIRIRAGVSRDGTITGIDFHGDFNTGAYASWGPTVANRVPVHASGPYRVPSYRATTRAVHTHLVPAGAFRGFGVPQAAIAQETIFEDLALKLGMDPLEFRLKNALGNGEPTVTGQVFKRGVGIRACLEALRPHWQRARAEAEAFNARQDRPASHRLRGAGLAAAWYGCGNTSLPNPSTIKAGIRAGGSIVLHQGAIDIGQGANTVIAQIFATALGAPLSSITLVGADTDLTPDAGKTSASRQTFVSGNAAKRAGESLRAAILRLCNAGAEAQIRPVPGGLEVRDGASFHRLDLNSLAADGEGYVLTGIATYDPPTAPLDANGQGEPYALYGYAAHLAELEVDLRLGTVKLIKITAAHDVGRAINPLLVEGQIEGGVAQG
ncbi:MAG: molybdopterin-dependent oxidoreductase, partial [Hyphomicrobiaceae bacterium]